MYDVYTRVRHCIFIEKRVQNVTTVAQIKIFVYGFAGTVKEKDYVSHVYSLAFFKFPTKRTSIRRV